MILSTEAKEVISDNIVLLRNKKFHKFIKNIYNKLEDDPSYFADVIEYIDNKGLRERYIRDIYRIYPFMYYCREFYHFIIPNNIYSIEEYAFSGCDKLEWIDIPKSVTDIGENAFQDCDNLVEIQILNPDCNIAETAFQGCDSKLQRLTIPSMYNNKLNKIFGDSFDDGKIIITYI